MIRFRFSVLMIPLVLAGCTAPDSFHTLTGTWRLWAFETPSEGVLEPEPDHVARSVVLSAKDRGKRGSYSVTTVTNLLEGTYRLGEEGSLEVESVDGTLFGEPAWGERFNAAWRDAIRYEIQPGQLLVYFGDGKSRMLFEPSR